METTIKFAKVNPNAKIPTKREEDAGYDIYACFDQDYITINPHETRLIPTEIASVCDKDYCFIIKERGSTGSKGIAVRCGVIDSGYRNPWFIGLTNTTNQPLFLINPNYAEKELIPANRFTYDCTKAIAQAILVPVPKATVEEISYEELQAIESERGEGALGSSGK
jgi:dUTP pyrophosphatase